MKAKIALTVDPSIREDFRKLNGGSVSSFLEEKMTEYVNRMRLQWWLICPRCKEKSHIRTVLNNGGFCTKENCKAIIAEKIEIKP